MPLFICFSLLLMRLKILEGKQGDFPKIKENAYCEVCDVHNFLCLSKLIFHMCVYTYIYMCTYVFFFLKGELRKLASLIHSSPGCNHQNWASAGAGSLEHNQGSQSCEPSPQPPGSSSAGGGGQEPELGQPKGWTLLPWSPGSILVP